MDETNSVDSSEQSKILFLIHYSKLSDIGEKENTLSKPIGRIEA